MKKTIVLLLAGCMLVSLTACGGNVQAVVSSAAAEKLSASTDRKIPADELERAVWYGLLPEHAGNMDNAVTWKQFCAMLGKVIALYDENKLPAWERETTKAPDDGMRRDGGMVALLFAAKAMGFTSFNAQTGDAFSTYSGRVWEVVTMDYPLFDWDTPIDLGQGCADSNHVGPAYDFSQRRVSLVSGLPLLEFDETGDLRLEQPLTLREAALAALRLYESDETCAAAALAVRDEAFFSTPEVREILAQGDGRRLSILNSNTEIVIHLVVGKAVHQVYDNLCIRYSSMTFVSGSANGVPTGNNSVIQNMEVGVMGGNVTGYMPASGSDDRISYNCGSMGCNGGGMAFNGSGITVQNNYVHHTFQEGISMELFEDCPSMENCTISGNLIECATQALLLCNWDQEVREGHMFRNIVVENNLVLYSGRDNWFNSAWEEDYCDALVLQGGPCAHDGTVQIRDNTFAFAEGPLILVDQYSEEYSRIFMGNTYVQKPAGTGVFLADTSASLTLTDGIKLLGDAGAEIFGG